MSGLMGKCHNKPLKSIKNKCIEYSNYQPEEVKECAFIDCPIYPFRFGKRLTKAIVNNVEEFCTEKIELG